MNDIISPFLASASVDHGGRCNTFAPEPHCDESQPEVEGGREGGRDRLLHMSVAMGILAQ